AAPHRARRGRDLHQLPRPGPPRDRGGGVRVARVAVVGAGTMGHGIAYAAALGGCRVALTDSRADALARALERIRELVAGGVKRERSDPGVIDRAVAFARQLGKEPILVKDSPGFASSRLGVALGLEAMRMLERGVATAEDIDKAMELGYNHPMGPLKLTDIVG